MDISNPNPSQYISLYMNNCNFNLNYASISGGVLYGSIGNITLENSSFLNNSCNTNHGGAFYLQSNKFILVNNSSFINN